MECFERWRGTHTLPMGKAIQRLENSMYPRPLDESWVSEWMWIVRRVFGMLFLDEDFP